MGNIVLLDDLTINKIAAGEVIERPASVVKEMLENSIDAGAKNITIEIKNGGIGKIKIADDGCGIAEDDMEIAFERHATSKIRSAKDLQKVMTMGFRGEALASIAAISKVEMVSKREEDSVGHKIVVEGGKTIEFKEATRSRGTTITVQNLFYNTPVRYKFLKKDYTEAGYIEDAVTRIALVNKDVSIQLISNGKVVLSTNGNGDLKTLIYSVYGKDIANEIKNVDYTYENIHITGVVGNPTIARGNRANQMFFLNGRYIKDKNLTAAADQALKDIVPNGRYGFLILNMEMDASLVDVNVHPAKLEVRFQDESTAFKSIYNSIKSVFVEKDEYVGTPIKKLAVENASNPVVEKNDVNLISNEKENDDKLETKAESVKEEAEPKVETKKGGKKSKKGLFGKNKKNDDEFENDPLADIYKSRKEKMKTLDETDMLKVNINDVIKNGNAQEESIDTGKKVTSVVTMEPLAQKEDEIAEAIEEKTISGINKKVESNTTYSAKNDSEENTMSNQEKIAKFIRDYHSKARHYNAEKLLKGIDEIVDENGNVLETNEKVSENIESKEEKNTGMSGTESTVSDDTTVFMGKDKLLENVSTKELDSHEVNELVKSINKKENTLSMQDTQIIVQEKTEDGTKNDASSNVDVKEVIDSDRNDNDGNAVTNDNAVVISDSTIRENEDVSNIEKTEDYENAETSENITAKIEKNAEEINVIGENANVAEGPTEEKMVDSELPEDIDLDNPYAINISNIDENTSTKVEKDISKENVYKKFENTENITENTNADKIGGNTEVVESTIGEIVNAGMSEEIVVAQDADEDGGTETERAKSRIFAKAKDELEKFTSFAGGLLSSKIDSQNTQLIDTKKVREAVHNSGSDTPSRETFEELPEFAEMYKKTFGVEPFSVRKERERKEQEKEKLNASSEFSYATENVSVFENEDDENEEEQSIQYKYIGQAFGNYIVIELNSEMYVIDIAACKRRLVFEDLKEKYYNDSEESQTLLLPDVIILSKKELRLAEENVEMFEKAGFKYESFGENTIKLIAVPGICEELNTKQLFVEILDNLDTVAIIDTREKEEKFLSIIALKIASNEIVDVDEEQSKGMLTRLLKYTNPFTSPDGKPIAIKMTKNDLDKKFSRR